jgi:hypothetical protein
MPLKIPLLIRIPTILAIASLFLFSCGPKWKEYRSPAGPVVKIPENWKQVTNLVEVSDIQFEDAEHQRYFTIVSEERNGLEHKTLERYSKFTRESIRGELRLPESLGPKYLEIGGLKAIQYEISGYVEQERFYYLHTIIEGKDHFHQLVGWTHASHRAENWPLLVKITESFRE